MPAGLDHNPFLVLASTIAMQFIASPAERLDSWSQCACRHAHVTHARISPILNLVNLAPLIREALLFLAPVESGKEVVIERRLGAVA